MENDKKWYVVYTKPRSERKVVDLLQKKRLKSYYPRYNKAEYWQERRKIVNMPLFTSMIFVYVSEKDHATIKQLEGVIGLMYWLNKPAVINNIDISTIRYFVEQHNNVRIEKTAVAAGSQKESERNIAFVQPSGVINFSNVHKVSLPSLGYTLISEAMVEEVKIVA